MAGHGGGRGGFRVLRPNRCGCLGGISQKLYGQIHGFPPDEERIVNPSAMKNHTRGYGVRGTPPLTTRTGGIGTMLEVIALGLEPRT